MVIKWLACLYVPLATFFSTSHDRHDLWNHGRRRRDDETTQTTVLLHMFGVVSTKQQMAGDLHSRIYGQAGCFFLGCESTGLQGDSFSVCMELLVFIEQGAGWYKLIICGFSHE
jgi:hypothetical protein